MSLYLETRDHAIRQHLAEDRIVIGLECVALDHTSVCQLIGNLGTADQWRCPRRQRLIRHQNVDMCCINNGRLPSSENVGTNVSTCPRSSRGLVGGGQCERGPGLGPGSRGLSPGCGSARASPRLPHRSSFDRCHWFRYSSPFSSPLAAPAALSRTNAPTVRDDNRVPGDECGSAGDR